MKDCFVFGMSKGDVLERDIYSAMYITYNKYVVHSVVNIA